jgi:hypothetical protein
MSANLICYARVAEEVKRTWPAGYYLQRFAVAHSLSAVACSASAASLGAAPFPPHRAATRRRIQPAPPPLLRLPLVATGR